MAFQFTRPRELNRLQREMYEKFGLCNGSFARPKAYPAINLLEDDDNLYVESEIPGMELDQFELYVNDENQLTLQGVRIQPNGETTTRHRQERVFGRCSRMISLPSLVDGDATTAEYVAGVLKNTLPKKPEATPRRIEVVAS